MTKAIALADGSVFLPKRALESHKGDYGKLLILGGCVGYTGAPSMCAGAALRSGAGLVYLGVPAPIYDITAVKNEEAMPFPLPADANGRFSTDAIAQLEERLDACDVCAVGPGMGKGAGCAALLRYLVQRFDRPLVIDADGLNMLAGQMELLKARSAPTVLTPHDGEFARLGGTLSGDRVGDALHYAREWNSILVLKGHRTIVAYPTGEVYITTHGNPGMAKGGSGDVLTGVIAAMLCQLPVETAVGTAVYLQSLAGDLACAEKGEYAMLATDIIAHLAFATKNIIKE